MNQEKEKFSLTNWEIVSVNPKDKNWTMKDYFCFWAVNTQSIISFSLIASLYILYNLNFFVVLTGTLFASVLIYLFSNFIGIPSQRHGIPFAVFLRTSLGYSGAKYFGLLRGIIGIFFFGVQTFFISKSIGYILRISLFNFHENIMEEDIFLLFFMGLNIIDWIALIFTFLFQYFLFKNGHHVVKILINFSGIFVYFGLVMFLIMVVSENYSEISNRLLEIAEYENVISKKNISPFIAVAGTMFAYFSILLVNFGDYSRYAKDESNLKKGNFTLIINILLFSFLTLFITLGADVIINKNLTTAERLLTNPTDIIGKIDNTYLTLISLLFILVASLSTNLIANYIPSQNALLNFLPKYLNLNTSGLIMIFIGIVIATFWLPVLSQVGILSIIDTIGAFFGPIAGLIIADYYFIKKGKIINKYFFSYNKNSEYIYSNGWNVKALYSIFIGFIFSASTIWNPNLNYMQSFMWIVGAVITLITYYLLATSIKKNESI